MSKKSLCEQHYDDWVKLLKDAKAYNLLSDPFAVFDEAWRQASIISTSMIDDDEESDRIQKEMLK